jgi:integrase
MSPPYSKTRVVPTNLAVMSAAGTGLRASEQWALRWRHLDPAAGKVTLVEWVDKRGGIDTTKSKAGKRTLQLGKSLVAALTRYRDASKFVDRDDFVFTNNRGGFVRHTNFTNVSGCHW